MWKFTGKQRPAFAEVPGPDQESVWDYPRPPVARPCTRRVEVHADGKVLAVSASSFRLLETASPPTFYLPPDAVSIAELRPVAGSSYCEWKGAARYWALHSDPSTAVAWAYPQPSPEFSQLANYVSFYPGRVACYVDGERVQPQPGGFYGGWITAELTGPFKGEPGTGHW